jgi:hypothetical protein
MLTTFVFATAKYCPLHPILSRKIAFRAGSSKQGNIRRAYAAAENVVAIYLASELKLCKFNSRKNRETKNT